MDNKDLGLRRSGSVRLPVCPSIIRSKFERSSLRLVNRISKKLKHGDACMPTKKSKGYKDEHKKDSVKHGNGNKNKNKSFEEAEKKRYVNENWKKMAMDFEEKHVGCIVEQKNNYYNLQNADPALLQNLPGYKKKRDRKSGDLRPEICLKNKIIEDLTTQYKSQLLPLNARKAASTDACDKKEVTFLDEKLKKGFSNAGFVESPTSSDEKGQSGSQNGIAKCDFLGKNLEDRRPARPKPIISPSEEFLSELNGDLYETSFCAVPDEMEGICNEGFIKSPEPVKNELNDLVNNIQCAFEIQLDGHEAQLMDTQAFDVFEYPLMQKPQRPDRIGLDENPEISDSSIDSDMKWYDFVSKMKKKSARKSFTNEKENLAKEWSKLSKRNEFLRRKSEEFQKETDRCLEEYKRFKRSSKDDVTLAEYCKIVQNRLGEDKKAGSPMEEMNQVFEYCLAQQEKRAGNKVRSKRFQRAGSVKLPKTKLQVYDLPDNSRRVSQTDARLSKNRNSIWKYGSTSSRFMLLCPNRAFVFSSCRFSDPDKTISPYVGQISVCAILLVLFFALCLQISASSVASESSSPILINFN